MGSALLAEESYTPASVQELAGWKGSIMDWLLGRCNNKILEMEMSGMLGPQGVPNLQIIHINLTRLLGERGTNNNIIHAPLSLYLPSKHEHILVYVVLSAATTRRLCVHMTRVLNCITFVATCPPWQC